jgi:chemotaxis signal transduction protein
MLIATMSSIQASVQQIRSSLKKMEKLGNMLNSTEENKNIITTMKNNMIFIDDEINKIVEILDYSEEDISSSDDEECEDTEMLYRLWIYNNERYILNMDTQAVYDYESEKVIGMNVNGILIKN